MIIKHSFKNISVSSVVESEQSLNLRFFLSNRKGGFFIHGIFNHSKYDGFFIREGNDEFKVFELDMHMQNTSNNSNSLLSINNEFYKIGIKYMDKEQHFIMPHKSSSLIYNSTKSKSNHTDSDSEDSLSGMEIFLDFDFRKNFDFRKFGRYYNIYSEEYNNKEIIVVEFKKMTDSREDSTSGILEYKGFSVVVADKSAGNHQEIPSVQIVNKWIKKDYDSDKLRNSDSKRFVFRALKLSTNKFVVTSGFNKEETIKEASSLYDINFDAVNKRQKQIFNHEMLVVTKKSGLRDNLPNHEKITLISSYNSLLSLLINDSPLLLAGFPWFFEEWFRDEFLSLQPFILMKPKLAKRIILKILKFTSVKDGKLPAKLNSNLCSSDALGILSLRVQELMRLNIFTGNELGIIRRKIVEAVEFLIENSYCEDLSLFYSGEKETWMDSLNREGYRIEIQALAILLLSLSYKLSNNEKYNKLIDKVKESIEKNLVVSDELIDGLNKDKKCDLSIRPNIFLAYYFYPQLFPKQEWELYFDNALKRLWLSWGGLSTVNKEKAVRFHTGENPVSYHNGDSWFFINNITAISMSRLNFKKYAYYIEKILKAGVRENLYSGVIGSSSELSSFSFLKSQGCLIQAWSNSTLFELLLDFFSERTLNS